jgi:DNA-3-methyladenine glycosylase
VRGADFMAKRRGKFGPEDLGLTNGPGKLVQALGIDRSHNKLQLFKKPLYALAAKREEAIGVTTRIGITEGSELPLRFFLKGNPYLSVKPGMDRPSPGKKKKMKVMV